MTQTRQTKIISELRQRLHSTETVVPFIGLRGRWLENAGFEIGDDVQIEVRENQLILTDQSRRYSAMRNGLTCT